MPRCAAEWEFLHCTRRADLTSFGKRHRSVFIQSGGSMATMVKQRNMLAQVGLAIITLGIYCIYWFYQTGHELKFLAKDDEASPGL